MNPLQRLRSIKVKLSIVIVAAVVVTLAVNEIGLELNFQPGSAPVVAAAIALLMVQLLARGMTSPLREMERAATAMADGDHVQTWSSPVRRRGRPARRGVQPHGRRARRGRPAASRPRRQRVPRAAHADLGAAGDARERGRRCRPGRPRAAQHDARPDRAAAAPRHPAARPEPPRVRWVAAAPRPFPAAELLDQVADEARLHSPDLAYAVRRRRPTDLEVDGDPERIHQVLANLVENAARFSPSDGEVGAAQPRVPGHVGVRGDRRWSGHRRGEQRAGSSSASTGPTRPGPPTTAAPASAWPSPAGSSTCTAAASAPSPAAARRPARGRAAGTVVADARSSVPQRHAGPHRPG